MTEQKGTCRTMKEWLNQCFGSTLCDLFFFPFHELYTAGLYNHIAPQDAYKSPVDHKLVIKGASECVSQVGYNVFFSYPDEGLNSLAKRMAAECDVHYNKAVVKIDVYNKMLLFNDDTRVAYNTLISTLPLNKVVEMSGIKVNAEPDPYTSVLVLNIGAVRGNRCPDDHWLYIPDANSGFHRVGFYSNVDRSFLPASVRSAGNRVGIYVERAFPRNDKPSQKEVSRYTSSVLSELQKWGFIGHVEVIDNTWIDIAYTWSWPGSNWRELAIKKLKSHDIDQIGRYGTWTFQGIADSIRDGLKAGAAVNLG
jgi:protoporphyrinogen oxidase